MLRYKSLIFLSPPLSRLHTVWWIAIVGSAQICLYSTSSLTRSIHYMWIRLFTALHNYHIWSHSSLERLEVGFFSFLLISYILQQLSRLFWCCGLITASNANLTTQVENYGRQTKRWNFHACVLRGSTWSIKASCFSSKPSIQLWLLYHKKSQNFLKKFPKPGLQNGSLNYLALTPCFTILTLQVFEI